MSDDVILPGTGESVASDAIGGVMYQRVKLTLGADGVNDGDVSASNPMAVKSPLISVAAAYSGQITVTTPGTSIQGSDVALTNGVYIKALGGNTGKMYLGYATGDNRAKYELSADQLILIQLSNLNQLWVDASVAGEKVCWLKA
jgi:hypothetical protein